MEFHGLSTGFGGYKFRLERFFLQNRILTKREFVKAYMQICTVARALWEYSILCLYQVAMQAPVFSYYETIVSE